MCPVIVLPYMLKIWLICMHCVLNDGAKTGKAFFPRRTQKLVNLFIVIFIGIYIIAIFIIIEHVCKYILYYYDNLSKIFKLNSTWLACCNSVLGLTILKSEICECLNPPLYRSINVPAKRKRRSAELLKMLRI